MKTWQLRTKEALREAGQPQPEKAGAGQPARAYIMAVDQGSSSTRVMLFDRSSTCVSEARRRLETQYPRPSWVEHRAQDIWEGVREMMQECLLRAGADWEAVAAIGITNQRETALLWERESGEALGPAVSWQCRRTAEFCSELKLRGKEALLRERTGLPADAYFSASKWR